MDIMEMYMDTVAYRLKHGELWTSWIDLEGLEENVTGALQFLANVKGIKSFMYKNIAVIFYLDETKIDMIRTEVEQTEPMWWDEINYDYDENAYGDVDENQDCDF